jgi:choline dehydrogenase-like flavoprotein
VLIDARTIGPDETIDADLCIVGGGAAGITIANEFVGHHARVVLIESGGAALSEATQNLYRGAPSAHHYHALDACRFRLLGGSTSYWGGWCRPLDSLDFEERAWVPYSGWPFSRRELEPAYERAQQVCKLGPFDYAVDSWKGTREASVLQPGAEHFGNVVFQIAPVRFGEAYCATLERSTNVRVMLNANAVEVVMDHDHRTAMSVRVATLAGNSLRVRARVVVCAAGGIENARLLLASHGVRNCGIGNEHGLVGRFFADHLHVPIGTVRLRSQVSPFYQSHPVGGVTVRGGLSLTEQTRRGRRLLGCGVTLHNIRDPHDVLSIDQSPHHYQSMRALVKSLIRLERPERFAHHVKNVCRRPDKVVSASFRKLVAPRARTLMVGVRAEQIPNRSFRPGHGR